jgi:hypothetical protein
MNCRVWQKDKSPPDSGHLVAFIALPPFSAGSTPRGITLAHPADGGSEIASERLIER